jgi:hypothetical protein
MKAAGQALLAFTFNRNLPEGEANDYCYEKRCQ